MDRGVRGGHRDLPASMMDSMNDDQIIALARKQVNAKRMAAVEQRWSGLWRWLPPTLVVLTLALFVAVPGPFHQKLLLSMGGVCALRPSHSYFAGGLQFPLESRTSGIYAGFLLALVWLLVRGRLGARRLGSPLVIGVLTLMVGSMAFDGINSTLFEVGLPYLYMPTNPLRLATGLLSGIAMAPFLVWLWSVVAAPRNVMPSRPVLGALRELAVPLALAAGFAALMVNGGTTFYYPVALTSVIGVVLLPARVTVIPILMLGGLEGRVTQLRQMVGPSALAVLVAFGVLALMTGLRWAATGPAWQL